MTSSRVGEKAVVMLFEVLDGKGFGSVLPSDELDDKDWMQGVEGGCRRWGVENGVDV